MGQQVDEPATVDQVRHSRRVLVLPDQLAIVDEETVVTSIRLNNWRQFLLGLAGPSCSTQQLDAPAGFHVLEQPGTVLLVVRKDHVQLAVVIEIHKPQSQVGSVPGGESGVSGQREAQLVPLPGVFREVVDGVGDAVGNQ